MRGISFGHSNAFAYLQELISSPKHTYQPFGDVKPKQQQQKTGQNYWSECHLSSFYLFKKE